MAVNLAVFSQKTRQDSIALLTVFIDGGVTDTKDILRALHASIDVPAAGPVEQPQNRKCPSCGKVNLRLGSTMEGLTRLVCKCGYSEVAA